MAKVDSLEIQIQAEASGANKELDAMIAKLNTLQKSVRGVSSNINFSSSSGIKNATRSVVGLNSGLKKTNLTSRSLTTSFFKMYSAIKVATMAFNGIKKAVKESSDYLEDLNYFTSAFYQVANNVDLSPWKELGYKSAKEYYDSFTERAKELTAKMSGFYPENTGLLSETTESSLGLNPSDVMKYQAMFGQMSSSMGIASEQALKLSNAMTMIGADLASIRNMDFETVWNNLSSGIVGGTRAIDKYGINIRNVNLQQKLYELGIDASIESLNQQDKALLRGIVILESSKYAWADLSKTINTPANQFRIFTANVQNLARAIGNLFLPVVAKVMPYVNGLTIALQRLFSWFGKIIGVDFSGITSGFKGIDNSGISDLLDETDELTPSIENATNKAKKLKSVLLGIDELNVINEEESGTDSFKVPSYSVSDALGGAFDNIYDEYMSEWNKAFAEMENEAQAIADKIEAIAKSVWDFITPFRNAISELWNGGLSKLASFTWESLKDFYNNFLVPLGTWAFGTEDKGLTKFVNTLNDLLESIDWEKLKTSLGNLWSSLEPFAERVGDGLNWFFEKVVVPSSKYVINELLIDSIEALATALDNANEIIDKVAPVFNAFWENFGKDWNTNYLTEIKESVSDMVAPFESLSNLLSDFSWGNFLEYAEDVAKFAKLISNPFGEMKITTDSLADGFKDTAKDKTTEMLDKIKEKFVTTFDSIREKIESVFISIQGHFAPLTEFFEGFGTRVGQIFEGISIIAQAVWITITDFFTENVFTPLQEKFGEMQTNVSEAFDAIWAHIELIWLGVGTWFSIHVVDPLKGLWDTATNTINGYFDRLWKGIKTGVVSAMNSVIGGIENALNFMVNGINKILNGFNKLVSWASKVAEVNWGGVELIPTVSLGRIQAFYNGGFPQYATGTPSRYSLFMAGEYGRAEMLGTVGGRTAVAGGAEITGIRDAVYSTGQTEATLLKTAVDLLQVIASKSSEIVFDTREGLSALRQQEQRNGYNMSGHVVFA